MPKTPWNILIIDDSPDDRAELRQMLLRGSERRCFFTEVELGESGIRACRSETGNLPDCVLLDFNLPDMDALEVLAALCADNGLPPCPVAVVTGGDLQAGENLLRAGAQDYIGKNWLTPASLTRSVGNAIARFNLLSENKSIQNKLEKAREVAEAANNRKDDFLAMLSHELRTPLMPVLLAVEAMREDDRLPFDIREQLGVIERNLTLETRLIDDLLDITAITSGKIHLYTKLNDTHLLIGLAIEIMQESALEKRISLEREFNAIHSGVVVDPSRFQQVIWNLLRNAIKFTPVGGKIIVRTSERISGENSLSLYIEVIDSGIGLEPSVLEKIFQPFEQASAAGARQYGGMGLGLAIARAIVKLHGGKISAQSAGLNLGATFVIELPNAIMPPLGISDAKFFPPISPVENPKLIHRRLLLVEDHEPTRQIVATMLTRDGYHVVAASNVAEALKQAAAETFDLVLSDLGLPDGSGIELMEKLREVYGLRGIALSGYGMEEDIAYSKAAGFISHLVKPVRMAELRKCLKVLD